jgi:hypothetical protein
MGRFQTAHDILIETVVLLVEVNQVKHRLETGGGTLDLQRHSVTDTVVVICT